MSLPEVVPWQALRGGRLNGLHFRRQHPIGRYILDFFCSSGRLAVEIDGAGHGYPGPARHDASRDRWLAGERVRVLRVAAADILKDEGLAGVLAAIAELAAAPSTTLRVVPLPRSANEEPEFVATAPSIAKAIEGRP